MANVLFKDFEASHGPQSLFGCLDAGWRDGSGFWVHPTAADAAIHGAAILHKEARTVSAVDYFAPYANAPGVPSLIPSAFRLLKVIYETTIAAIIDLLPIVRVFLLKRTMFCLWNHKLYTVSDL